MVHMMEANSWDDIFSDQTKHAAIQALEQGNVIYFPKLEFGLSDNNKTYLTPNCLSKNAKNISFNPLTGEIRGHVGGKGPSSGLREMMERFSKTSHQLLCSLFPHYQFALEWGRTSFRPAEIAGRKSSARKDDTRLHVDAFPATPNQGKRILRVFSNVNPEGMDRVWLLGEPFETVLKRFKSSFRKPYFGSRRLLQILGLTKSYRSLYDHYMLILHDAMKLDEHYQNTVSKREFRFAAQSTWIVMTDQVSHAALSGQHVLEQTFYLPVESMQDPNWSPLRMLAAYI